MKRLRVFLLRIHALFYSQRLDRDLNEEISSHLAEAADEYRQKGLSPQDAHLAARRSFGGVTQAQDLHWDLRSFAWVEDLRRDMRDALRRLAKAPGFTVPALLILALSIGSNVAIFSAVNTVLFRPIHVLEPDRLIVMWITNPSRASDVVELSYREFEDWRARSRSVTDMAAMGSSNWTIVMDGRGEPVRLPYAGVTTSFFDTLGARPFLGRGFQHEDDLANGEAVIVLNYGTWLSRFGADPTVLGQTVTLDRKPYTIVGVMPEGFDFPRSAAFWTPVLPILRLSVERWGENVLSDIGVLFALGRLREGTPPVTAAVEFTGIVRELREAAPANVGAGVRVTPFVEYLFGPVRQALWLLLGAVAVLLLVACANISALMIARASLRRREHGIRLALGATRWRLGRLWLLESVTLGVTAGALGLLTSYWMAVAIAALGPDDVPGLTGIAISLPVAAFCGAAIVVTALLCAIAPLRHAGATSLLEVLSDAARSTPGHHSRRARATLVVLQIAFAVVLLVGAGLIARSFVNLRRVNWGFSPANVLTMHLTPRNPGTSANEWVRELLSRVETLPGVQAAGAIYLPPLVLGAVGSGTWFLFEGQPDTLEATRDNPTLNYQIASPDYFRAMGIPVRRGRVFDDRDDERSPRVLIVGANTAARLWPGENPIGKRLGLPSFAPGKREVVWRTVVGVVEDVRYQGLHDAALDVYDSALQAVQTADHLVIRTTDDPIAMAAALRTVARDMDPHVVIDRVTTLQAVVSRVIAPWRLGAWLLTVFAVLAALVAGLGLFSLVRLETASRHHEFAVRMALGASSRDVLRLVIRGAGRRVVVGLGAGLVVAFFGARLLESMFVGVDRLDGVTYVGVIALILGIVAIASYLPARQATRFEPLTALQTERRRTVA